MTSDINLKELEKKAWMSTYEDGFVDIIIGMLLVNFAVALLIDELIGRWYILIMVPIPVLFALLLNYFGKRNITAPRIGVAKFGAERKAAKKNRSGCRLCRSSCSSRWSASRCWVSSPMYSVWRFPALRCRLPSRWELWLLCRSKYGS
ncbi:hypothetical protein ACFL1R_13420 [Candidatus Latescibacterota bacterium]